MDNIWLLDMVEPYQPSKESIIWYKSLSIEQKIGLKELSPDITGGITFDILIRLFNFKGAISLLHEKLVLEKII
jgi:hypothetical protein